MPAYDGDGRSPAVPLATFRGSPGPGGPGCLVALVVVTGLLVLRGAAPELGGHGHALLGGCGLVVLLACGYQRWRRPRVVFAELHADAEREAPGDRERSLRSGDRLALRLAGGRDPVSATVLFLRELRAFRLEPGGEVRLLRGPAPSRVDLRLPPGGAAELEALERCLVRSGVRRLGEGEGVGEAPALPPPLLVVQGRPGVLSPLLLGATLALLLAALVVDAWPELVERAHPMRLLADELAAAPFLVLLLLLPWLLVHVALEPRRGRVVFRDDRVELERSGLVCAWADLVGHEPEAAPGRVQLLLRPGALFSPGVWVPTPSASDRDAVLALLAARQVPRVRPEAAPSVPGARPAPRPLTTLEGLRPRSKADLPGAALPVCALAGLAAFAATQLAAEAMGLRLGPEVFVPALVVALAGGGAVAIAFQRWLRARAGLAELFPDRVCLRQGLAPATTCFLADVTAYDDGSSDVVWLLRPGGLPLLRPAVGVPASDEAGRGLLLETLERAGVPRGADAARRTVAPAAPPLLVAPGGWRPPAPGLLLVCCAGGTAGVLFAEPPWDVLAAGLALVTVVFAALAGRLGRVTFRPDRVVAPGTTVAWDDVVGFSAREPGRLHLHLRPSLALLPPAVRVPDAAALEAVRALLLARGVPDVGAWLP